MTLTVYDNRFQYFLRNIQDTIYLGKCDFSGQEPLILALKKYRYIVCIEHLFKFRSKKHMSYAHKIHQSIMLTVIKIYSGRISRLVYRYVIFTL